jgi:hypothetical protein
MIKIVTGLPGSGKSYYTAQKSVELLYRNKKWYDKQIKLFEQGKLLDTNGNVEIYPPKRRKVVSNLKLNEALENEFGFDTPESFLEYWEDAENIPHVRDADLIWEEMGAILDSRNWESLPIELRRWLQQHRHRGVSIYGNCQEFADIDIAVRRLTEELIYLRKIIGSRDPSPTSPPVKYVWGIILELEFDPRQYDEKEKFKAGNWSFGGIDFITRKIVNIYDMRNDIKPGRYPSLQHRLRECETCGFKKVIHV